MVKDPFERVAILGAGMLMTAFFFAIVVSTFGLGIRVPTCVTDVPPFDQPAVVEVAPGEYVVNMVAQMWLFNPREIRIPAGSRVTFNVVSKDVQHGLMIEGTNINLMAIPGVVNRAQARFDRPGEYLIVCHEYCGVGHHAMFAKLIVEPRAAGSQSPNPVRTMASALACWIR
ncbi:MAG: cytochrome c oxidase subunit II [Thermoflexus sp.]|nr:cytochrome c oxidase subunit II [Thermoflexus sp.]